jgi:hypothetical protein
LSKPIVFLLMGFAACGCGQSSAPDRGPTARGPQAITGGEVRTHMAVLAADDMQGREAGTRGHLQAAIYVASRFADMGLQQFGDSYFQDIDFLETRLVPGSAALALHGSKRDVVLEDGKDFVRSGGYGRSAESITAPLAFVGFGIQAPEYGHDDFAGIDVAGKILVVLTGAPPGFADNERAFYSSSAGKQALAARLGAVGLVTIRTPVDLERLTWPRMIDDAASSSMRWLEHDGSPHEGFAQLSGNAILSESGAAILFTLAGRDIEAAFDFYSGGGVDSFDFDITATMSRQSVQRRVSSPNVLALIRGSDPALRGEYLLYTAHLDHLGVHAGIDGDDIYNGAYDNAAGVATMLAVAGAIATMRMVPRRSIIFAAVTAEEKGLRGSDYLARNPPVAIDDIVANINIDMPFLGHPIANVEGFGVEHSTLHEALQRAAADLGLELTPDSRPELVRLIRSDQFSFVKQGVPGLNLKPGSMSSDTAIDGAELRATFLREHYHGPHDDLDLTFNEYGAERFARVALRLGLIVANEKIAPKWKEGDFFGKKFGRR